MQRMGVGTFVDAGWYQQGGILTIQGGRMQHHPAGAKKGSRFIDCSGKRAYHLIKRNF